ncbi:MAG: PAS domain-containing protein, partial [Betaproteobacteria bacterium]
MKRPSTRFFVAMGLASLLGSVLLLAIFIGVVPDRVSAIRLGRAALAESIGASTSTAIALNDAAQIQATLAFIVERNPDLLSAAVRMSDGEIVAVVGDHVAQWTEVPGSFSIDSQVRVPIMQGEQGWGSLDLRFKPLSEPGLRGFVSDQRVQMLGFVVGCCFVAFYFYLGRVLRQLDPSRAVPERVRTALDTMAEGLLVVDTKGYIVLANQAFASIVGKSPESLTGSMTSDFGWLAEDGAALTRATYPWIDAMALGIASRNARVALEDCAGRLRSFLVNSSPVLGSGGKQG